MVKVITEKSKPKQPRRSTETPSIWELGGLTVVQLGKRVWTAMDSEHDDIIDRAAQLGFWYFMAVFPGLLMVTAIIGLVAGHNPGIRDALFQYASQALPPSAWQLVQQTITQTAQSTAGWKFVVGLLGALWSASGGTSSTMTVLNFAYEVKDKRPYWKSRILVAVSLTIVLTTLMFAALAIVLAGGAVVSWATAHGLSSALAVIWKILQYAIALFFVVLAFAVLYHYGPDIEDQKWYWITPGSVIGVLLWIVASAGFRVYLHFFNSYSATYGSLGAVIILMLWFYITGLAFLVGAEINAEIEHAAAERGRADAKLKGEREAPAA